MCKKKMKRREEEKSEGEKIFEKKTNKEQREEEKIARISVERSDQENKLEKFFAMNQIKSWRSEPILKQFCNIE